MRSEKRAQRKYCGKCGNHLWDPCINCGESNSAEEEFCGGCGTNLKAALSKIAERIDKDIAQARFLMKEYRYADAISLLKPITTAKHSRLAPLAGRANDLFEQCLDRQQELTPRIRKIEEEIKQYIASGDIDQAARKADEIPEALRSQDLCDLIKKSQDNQAEITELNKAVAQLKDGSLTVELVAKIERLLVLQPDHDEARTSPGHKPRRDAEVETISIAGDYEKAIGFWIKCRRFFTTTNFAVFASKLATWPIWLGTCTTRRWPIPYCNGLTDCFALWHRTIKQSPRLAALWNAALPNINKSKPWDLFPGPPRRNARR